MLLYYSKGIKIKIIPQPQNPLDKGSPGICDILGRIMRRDLFTRIIFVQEGPHQHQNMKTTHKKGELGHESK